MNINDYVTYELTDFGKEIIEKRYIAYPKEFKEKAKTTMQLWEFCHVFGPHLYMGNQQVFLNGEIKRNLNDPTNKRDT